MIEKNKAQIDKMLFAHYYGGKSVIGSGDSFHRK